MTLNKLEELGYSLILGETFQGKNYNRCIYAKNYAKDNIRIIIDYNDKTMYKTKNTFGSEPFTFEEIKVINEMIGDD